ncbi:GPI mannosyltransferase 4 [Culex pipiens pallens]|uniref:GPI mannosyltransferase 4 n=1 Tax=Culex pipiens pallens TaxID=42434 RepID=UPI001954BE73|nr:GPI mannosyltransferase 4 [Culex pipiens pallens]
MHPTMHSKSIKAKDSSLVSYYIMCFVRIAMVFIPQVGYIHPDEFFQTVEVVAGDEYGLDVRRTWEFDKSFPIRSMVIPFLGLKIPFGVLRFVSMYTRYFLGINLRGSYVMLVFPRLIMVALSFVNDWSLAQICKAYGLQSQFRLLTLASSYVMLVYSIRTFTNSIEMALCSLLLYIVSDCMIHSNTVIYQQEFLDEKYQKEKKLVEKVKLYKLRQSLPSHSLNRCVLMSTLCVAGVFNRPTFLLFGLPLVFHWLLRGLGTKKASLKDFNIRIFTFVLSGIPALLLFILGDSFYYGYLTMPEIEHLDVTINNFVVTPLNFVRYNINPNNTGAHGTHPFYLHLAINVPLLYNVLGVIALASFGVMMYRFASNEYTNLPRAQSFVGLMICAIFFPIVMLSFINHQEPRFLIPITLPLILLHAPKLKTGLCSSYPFKERSRLKELLYNYVLCAQASARPLLRLWYTFNIILTIFYGFVHQAGVYQLAAHMSQQLAATPSTTQTYLITSHIYDMPYCFLDLPSTNILVTNPQTGQRYRRKRTFFLSEYGSLPIGQLYTKVKLTMDMCRLQTYNHKTCHVYLAIPSSLSEDLNNEFQEHVQPQLMSHNLIKVFYAHLSMEAPPKLLGQHLCGINTDLEDAEDTCSIYAEEDSQDWLTPSRMLKQFSSLAHQFGLALYEIKAKGSKPVS